MIRLVRALLASFLLLGFVVWAAAADAEDRPHRAGLVVDYGDGTVTYGFVPFSEESISGVELLRRSGVSLVTVDFGGLGQGVCSIGERGCGIGDCRQRLCQTSRPNSPYWRYFRLTEDREWAPMTLGASSVKVEDGEIDGWSWTGEEHSLPLVDLDEIERLAGSSSSAEGDPAPVATTYDTSGRVMTFDRPRSSTTSYAAAIVVVGALVALAAVLAIRRRRSTGASP